MSAVVWLEQVLQEWRSLSANERARVRLLAPKLHDLLDALSAGD